MNRFLDYINYLLFSSGRHAIQASFLYNLYTNVITANNVAPIQEIEYLRNQALLSNETISFQDMGAGTKLKQNEKRIRDIAICSVSPLKFSLLQYRLIQFFKPEIIIELGTSIGINTLYLAKAYTNAKVYTLEGAPAIAELARKTFGSVLTDNIELIEGNFNDTLPKTLKKLGRVDYMFIDGNHKYEPTIRYFQEALNYSSENAVFLIDDLYWSEEMKRAWCYIKNHPQVTLTLDLYRIGIVFISKRLSKQNFVLRY